MARPKWLTDLKQRLAKVPIWLWISLAAIGGILLGLIFDLSDDVGPAVIGLLGVLLGSLISMISGEVTARQERRAQIALATWSRRLEVHQEAFALWYEIWQFVYGPPNDRQRALADAETWWRKNSLYLSGETRDAFKRMIMAASQHQSLVDAGRGSGNENSAEAIKRNWKQITDVGPLLKEGAGGHITDEMLRELASDPGKRERS